MTAGELLRSDQRLIADLVPSGARVLDLGCGDGALLDVVRGTKSAFVRGVELDPEKIALCIDRGLSVFQGDLDEGLADFRNDSFDLVLLSQTLQVVHKPQLVVAEMLRVGKRAVVSFPNFAYWRHRARLAFTGRMPVSKALPYEWYDTPNIHFTTFKDFSRFAEAAGGHVEKQIALSPEGKVVKTLPNLLADSAVFVLGRGGAKQVQPLPDCCQLANQTSDSLKR